MIWTLPAGIKFGSETIRRVNNDQRYRNLRVVRKGSVERVGSVPHGSEMRQRDLGLRPPGLGSGKQRPSPLSGRVRSGDGPARPVRRVPDPSRGTVPHLPFAGTGPPPSPSRFSGGRIGSSAEGSGRDRIQWSLIIMPRDASRRGMWHATQPVTAETLQWVFEGPWWQDRHTTSYAGRSVDALECGSWHVEHDRLPSLFR